MDKDKVPIYRASDSESPLRQGEILTNITQFKPTNFDNESLENIEFERIIHPFAIIVTQDCDLDWDYKARFSNNANRKIPNPKLLNSIILCEIDTAENIRNIKETTGKNLLNSKDWNLVSSHRHERFYFFEKIPAECELETKGLPELTADFKKVFGINPEFLYHQIKSGEVKRRSVLVSPYLEHFSKRYYHFHSRVALPHQYESEKQNS
jgi:hypothetical protein